MPLKFGTSPIRAGRVAWPAVLSVTNVEMTAPVTAAAIATAIIEPFNRMRMTSLLVEIQRLRTTETQSHRGL
jgi:hypothetical protein